MSRHQSPRGLIQLNVNPDTGYVSTENAGAVDGNLWYILGHYLYFLYSNDLDFLQRHWPCIDKALVWLSYQDMNECGLLEVPEAGNWMDLLAVRYNVLYDNALYYAATLAHAELAKHLPEGTPVFAAGGGTVIFKGWSTWGYGYTVVIAHGGTLSIYGHLNGAFVGCGEVVTPGQNIAVTGNSGRSSGPHLHFEIRGAAGVPVNPWSYQSF